MDNKQRRDYIKRMVSTCDRDMVSKMDMLYNHGKDKGWPKEIMDYLMWWEHETIRIPWRLRCLGDEINKLELKD